MAKKREPQAVMKKGLGNIDTWVLSYGSAVCEVMPARGGLVTRFAVDGDEVLFLDPETVIDRKLNVRGGIPVLFPIAGRLPGDRYTVEDKSYPLRQHGLARQAPWAVTDVAAAHLTMELCSTPATCASYPFEFALRLTVDVGLAGGRTLSLKQEVLNLDRRALPVHMGLHPYFAVPEADKGRTRIETNAKTAYNNVTSTKGRFEGVDLTASEVDLHLLDHARLGTKIHIPGRQPRVIGWSEIYKVMVLWTVATREFICVEPWTAPAGAMLTGEGLLIIPPGESVRGTFTISV